MNYSYYRTGMIYLVAKEAAKQFKSRLEKNRINVTIRREMGRDINGACGQLRNNAMKKRKEQMDA